MATTLAIWLQFLIVLVLVVLTNQAQEMSPSKWSSHPNSGISTKCTLIEPLNVKLNLNKVFDPSQDLVRLAISLQDTDTSKKSPLTYLEHENNIVDPFTWVLARGEKGIVFLSFPFDFNMLSLGVIDAGSRKKVPLNVKMSDTDFECFNKGSDSDRLSIMADIFLNATMGATADRRDASICLERHSDNTNFVAGILLGSHITLQINTVYSCWTRSNDGNLVTFDVQVMTPWLRSIMSLEQPAWYYVVFAGIILLSSTLFVHKCRAIGKLVERSESKLDMFIRCARFLCLIHFIPTAAYIITHFDQYWHRKVAAMKTNGPRNRNFDILHFFLCICVIQLPILYQKSYRVFSRRTLMTTYFIISVFILTWVNVVYVAEVVYFTFVGLWMYPERIWLIILLAIRSILIVRASIDVHRFLRFESHGLSFLQFVIKRGTQPEFSIFFVLSLVHTCADPLTLSPVTIALLSALFINWIRYILTPSEFRYQSIDSVIYLAKEKLDGLTDSKRLDSTYGNDSRLFAAAYFDPQGGFLSIEGTGVGLFIPRGALNGEEFVYLYIQDDEVNMQGLEERNGDVLSPIVCCGPPGLQFMEKVWLYMPHCASVDRIANKADDWQFEASFCRHKSSAHYSNWTVIDGDDLDIFSKWVVLRVDHFTKFGLFGFKRYGRPRKHKRIGCFGKTYPKHAKTYRFRLWFCDDTNAAFKKVCREEKTFPGWIQLLPPTRLTVQRTNEDVLVNIYECLEGWTVRGNSSTVVPYTDVWRRGRPYRVFDLDFKGTDPALSESVHCTVHLGQISQTSIELRPQPEVVEGESQAETHIHRLAHSSSISEKLYPDIRRINKGRLTDDAFYKISISLEVESDHDWRLIGQYIQESNLDDEIAGENSTMNVIKQRFKNSSPAFWLLEHCLECVERRSLYEGRNFDPVETLRELFTKLGFHEALHILQTDIGEI